LLIMQANLGGSLAAGWSRLLGTAVGAFLGVVCLAAFGPGLFSLGIGVMLTTAACLRVGALRESQRLAAVTTAVIIILGEHAGPGILDAATLGFDRFLEIAIGVAVGLAVTFTVWPSRAKHGLAKGIARVLGEFVELESLVWSEWMDGECRIKPIDEKRKQLRLSRSQNRALLAEAAKEPGGLTKPEQIMISLMNFQDRIFEDILAMEHACVPVGPEGLRHKMAEELSGLYGATQAAMLSLAGDIEAKASPGPQEKLARALVAAEEKLATLRLTKATSEHDLDEVMRFFSFHFSLRSLAEEILGMTERTRELVGAYEEEG
jgi:uncharacterized membrane protein YccC